MGRFYIYKQERNFQIIETLNFNFEKKYLIELILINKFFNGIISFNTKKILHYHYLFANDKGGWLQNYNFKSYNKANKFIKKYNEFVSNDGFICKSIINSKDKINLIKN